MTSATWSRNGFNCAATAEAYAILAAMHLALTSDLKHMIFESDCEAVIRKLNRGIEKDIDISYLGSVLEEIWKISEKFDMCSFRFIPRSGNRVAHCLAQ